MRLSLIVEMVVLAAVAPFLLFPSLWPVATAAALAALVAVWALTAVLRREAWPLTPLNGALLLFIPMVGVGILVSALPDLTLPKATGLILGLAAFRAFGAARTPTWRKVALGSFVLVGLGIVAGGVLSTAWAAKIPGLQALTRWLPEGLLRLPDAPEGGVNPNELAGALTLYLPLPLGALLAWRPAWRRLLTALAALSGLFLAGGVLFLTQSRSGWLGGAAGVFVLVVLVALRQSRRWVRLLGVALVLLLAAGAAWLWLGTGHLQQAFDGAVTVSPETPAGTITLQGRVEIWSRALYVGADFPFTGCGLGTFRRVVPILYPPFPVSPERDIAHAHNIFLQVMVDLGLPGLISYLALLGAAATAWRAARPWPALALLAGLVGFHVYGLTDAVAPGAKPALAFWLLLGLIATLPWAGETEKSTPRAAGP